MYRVLILCGIAVLAASDADAVEALSTEELVSHCIYYEEDPESVDGVFCVRYIQGFIDGAVATDERVTKNVSAEYERSESFSQRATRTRLGSRIERFETYYAEFCLGEPVPLKTVVELVVADLENANRVANQPLARDFVYATLRTQFPCDAAGDE
ncbi:MAG: Rap1a/Tai family immunity protein [Woeseiaceae bacterium]|nr:Rap1a/Tai family immunity protein [Woeseiaceae bacterium]